MWSGFEEAAAQSQTPRAWLPLVDSISASILKKASDPQQISDTISAGRTGEQQASRRRIKVRQPENQHTWTIIGYNFD